MTELIFSVTTFFCFFLFEILFGPRIPKVPNTLNWNPNRASVLDALFESLRKHLVVSYSERLFQRLHNTAEKDDSFALKLINIASFSQRNKIVFINMLPLNKPCEYTYTKTFNKKMASLSIAKTTATFFVACVFGLIMVGTDILPVIDEKKGKGEELQKLMRSFNVKMAQTIEDSYAKFENLLKTKMQSVKNNMKI